MKSSRRAFVTALAVGICTLLAPSLSGATAAESAETAMQTPLEGPYLIVSGHSERRCLDADVDTLWYNGGVVHLWGCTPHSDNQWWYFQAVEGQSDVYYIVNARSGKLLDADLNTIGNNGSVVHLWERVDGNTNQWWRMIETGGTKVIQNVRSGQVLDADLGAIGRDGTRVQLWVRLDGANQKWEA
ncbi:RICIN domain-containing protein [Micromonospora sp. NPDC047707]|uniref:RICIN domain-containing protein n=1 Tax=Micromonospora sp. NPDC047707 TaxID=3154498 RepID=UPI003455DCC5